MKFPVIIVLELLMTATLAAAPDPSDAPAPERRPVPKYAEQNKADRAVREKYKAQLANRNPTDRLALAHQFQELGDASTSPGEKYVLLRFARDCAVNAGDLPYAMSIVDDTAKWFDINAPEMKASALSLGIDASNRPPAELAASYLKVADDALAAWDADLAAKAAVLAHMAARGNAAIMAEANARSKSAKLLNHELVDIYTAQRKLLKTPDDAELNLKVGRHLCLHLQQWDFGLPYLAKSPPGPLRELAEKELAAPADPSAMAALGDAWWDFKDPQGEVSYAEGRRRAAFWYARALPRLSGDRRAQAEKRLAEARQAPALSP